jgi:hypothetical protein
MSEVGSIFAELEAGFWDEGLDALIEAVVARRQYVRAQQGAKNKMEFVPGTKVRLVNIKPKYLLGITGEVTGQIASRSGDLMVFIDQKHWHQLGRYDTTLSIPASSLEEVA